MMPARKLRLSDFWTKPSYAAYVFILPSLLALTLFVLLPLAAAAGISMTNMNLFFTRHDFVGLANYRRVFTTARIGNSFLNTLSFMAMEVPLQVLMALFFASLLFKNTLFNRISRSTLFIPVVCSLTSISIIWSMILDPTIGYIPYLLSRLNLPSSGFLKDVRTAMPLLAFITAWKNFGHSMIILLAGMTGIDTQYYEASEMDGASPSRQFTAITLPMLAPTIGFCTITAMINALQMFDQAYVTTKGGPLNATETVVMYIYTRAFSAKYELGFSSAVAVILFLVIAAVSLTLNKGLDRYESKLY